MPRRLPYWTNFKIWTNQLRLKKYSKIFKPTNKRTSYKTLGNSIIYSIMFQPSLVLILWKLSCLEPWCYSFWLNVYNRRIDGLKDIVILCIKILHKLYTYSYQLHSTPDFGDNLCRDPTRTTLSLHIQLKLKENKLIKIALKPFYN